MFNPSSPVPQWIADLESRKMVQANDAALAFWRMTREEFLTIPVEQFFHPDEIPRWKKYIQKSAWGESGPWKCLRGDGSMFYCTTRWQMLDYAGKHCAFVFPVRAGETEASVRALRF